MKSLAEARLKRVRALELVAEGKSYAEIARLVGYSHRGSAHRAVFKALQENEVKDVETLRALEADRLDVMLAALWPRIQVGDTEAIQTALTITDRRIRLFGLAPKTSSTRSTDGFTSMVVTPAEGNPGQATLEDVQRWSWAARDDATQSAG